MAERICSVDDCGGLLYARGWCKRHWFSWWRHGDPETARRRRPNGEALAWLLANYEAPIDGPCVLWPFATGKHGYGIQIRYQGRNWQPHALAVLLRNGPRPDGAQACHGACHEPRCIVHVNWRTPSENAHDRVRDGTDIRGEKAPMGKLTADQVREIRQLLMAGVAQKAIAKGYGVRDCTISNIKRGRSWYWLD